MIRIRDIALPPAHSAEQLQYEAAQLLRLSPSRIRKLTIVRRSVDARKKPDVKIIYTVDVAVEGSVSKEPQNGGVVRCRSVTLREKMLTRLLGRKERVMILIPGNTVESLDITELSEGGAACE